MSTLQWIVNESKKRFGPLWRLCQEWLSRLRLKWSALDRRQKMILSSLGCVACVSTLVYAQTLAKKRQFEKELQELKKQGYYPTDGMTTMMSGLARVNESHNVHQYHSCDDSFSFKHCVEYWTNMAIQHIAFRSITQYKLNTYFWIECCNVNPYTKVGDGNQDISKTKVKDIPLTKELTRLKFMQLYGFDIVNRLKFRVICFAFVVFFFFFGL